MLSLTITTVLLIIIVGLIIVSIIKSAIKVTLSLIFVLLILLIVGGYFFAVDLNDFRNDFVHNQTIYILEDNGTLITAFSLDGLNLSSFKPVSVPVAEKLVSDSENLSNQRLFIISKSVLTENASGEIFNLTGYSFEDALNSSDNKLRASAFVVSFIATFKKEGIFYFFKQVRLGNMAILPKTFAVKVLTFNSDKYLSKVRETVDSNKRLVDDLVNVVNTSKNVLKTNISV